MTDNPYLARKIRQGIGKVGRKSEKKTAVRLTMRITPASGAAMAKGDMRDENFLLEAKSTQNDSLGVKLDWLVKIAGEASMVGKEPGLSIVFSDPTGRPRPNGRWVCMPEHVFKRLVQGFEDKDA